jgi:hypothetical protein
MARTPHHTDDQFPPTSPDADEAERRFRARPPDPNLARNPHVISKLNRTLVVERMMLDGVADQVVIDVVSRQFDKAEATIKDDIKHIRRRWTEEDDEQRRTYKSSAMRRIQSHISEARKDRAWGAVSSLERLLAQIQGTLEPVQVNVEFVAKQALADYISNLSDEELEALALEQKEIERKAAMFDRGIDPTNVFDTQGTTVQ